MDAGRATSRVESSRSSRARPPPMRPVFGSVRFGSVRFGSFVRSRHVVSVAFATKSAQSINRRAVRFVRVASRGVCDAPCGDSPCGGGGVWDFVVCDSPLRTRAYGMVGVGRSSCLNTMEKVHIGRPNGYRRVARARVDVLM